MGFGAKLSVLFGESSSGVLVPLPPLAGPPLSWLPIEPTLSTPGRNLGFGARDTRLAAVRLGGIEDLFPTPGPPERDCLDVLAAGIAGGPIDVRFPPTLGRDFALVAAGAREFEGVPVLGVATVDVAADNCLVGDLVGD